MFNPQDIQNNQIIPIVPINIPKIENLTITLADILKIEPEKPIFTKSEYEIKEYSTKTKIFDEINELIKKYNEFNINIDIFEDHENEIIKINELIKKYIKYKYNSISIDDFNEIYYYLNNEYDKLNNNNIKGLLNKLNILIILLNFIFEIIKLNNDFNDDIYNINFKFVSFASDEINNLNYIFNNKTIKAFKKTITALKSTKYQNYYYYYINYINIFEKFRRQKEERLIFNQLIDYFKIIKIFIIDSFKNKIKINIDYINDSFDDFKNVLFDFFENYGDELYYLINNYDDYIDYLKDELDEFLNENENEDEEDEENEEIINIYNYFIYDFINDLKRFVEYNGNITNEEFKREFGQKIDDLFNLIYSDDLIDLFNDLYNGNKARFLKL